MLQSWVIYLLVVVLPWQLFVMAQDPAEQLFREAAQEYMTRMQQRNTQKAWDVWYQLADTLLSESSTTPLQKIGALEESILMIERAIYEMGQPDDPIRDKAREAGFRFLAKPVNSARLRALILALANAARTD